MEYQSLCEETITAVKEAGRFIQGESKKLQDADVGLKGKNDLVTRVDVAAEQLLVDRLQRILPEAGILAEEEHQVYNKEKTYNWVIDPLDGTLNFVQQIPVYSVSVALLQGEKVKLGVVLELNLDECFYAFEGGGAWLHDKQLGVGQKEDIGNAVFATGFPVDRDERAEFYVDLLKAVLKKTRGIRRIGSAAVDLCYTAAGRFDGYYEFDLKPWDVAAGSLIVREAGGEVSDLSGSYDYIFGGEITAGNKPIINQFLNFYNQFQPKSSINDH